MEAPAEVMEAPAEKANTAKGRKREKKMEIQKKGERGKGFPSLAPRLRGQLELALQFKSWPLHQSKKNFISYVY